MTDEPNPPDNSTDAGGMEDIFEKECHLCGETESLVPNQNMPWLFTCEDCLGRWQSHLEQIEERDEPPPSVE